MPKARTLALTLAAAGALAAPAAASANTVIDWNVYAERATQPLEQRDPGLARLAPAMVQGAVYDAVNAITRTNQPYLVAPRARRWYSKDAATATAAYRTLTALLPEQRSTLEPLYERSLAAIGDGAAKAGGFRVGTKAAAAMLAARENDGRGGPSPVVIGTEPGQFRLPPPAWSFVIDPSPWLGNVKPFLVPSAERLRTRGPNALTSRAYAREFAETKELGSATSTTRTPDQTEIARYWDMAPWGDILRSIAQSQNLNTTDTARMLAMVNLAGADAAIGCSNDKYTWNTWRPITAIREAATDGNPATTPDPGWLPLIQQPYTNPEHPSGHTCGSGAIVATLQTFFDTDKVAFSATSFGTGTTRSFTRFSQALDENLDARVFGGMHFRAADVQGAQLGQDVVRWMRSRYFKPTSR